MIGKNLLLAKYDLDDKERTHKFRGEIKIKHRIIMKLENKFKY